MNKRSVIQKMILMFIVLGYVQLNVSLLAQASVASSTKMSSAITMEYIKDETNELTLEDIRQRGDFQALEGQNVSFGYSRATWWLRIKVMNVHTESSKQFFTLNNPYMEKVQLYFPAKNEGNYIIKQAGWGFQNHVEDVSFIYPVFEIPDQVDFEEYIYLRSDSVYTQNFQLNVISDEEFSRVSMKTILFMSLLFGVLLSVLLYNVSLGMFLKEKVYMKYCLFVLLMTVYQAALVGIFKVIDWPFAYVIEQYTATFGFFSNITVLIFVREFLQTKQNLPIPDKLLKGLIFYNLIDVSLFWLDFEYISLVISTAGTIALGVFVLITAIMSIKKGLRQARYFLIAWSAAIIGTFVFVLRGTGVIPQSFLTMNFLLMSTSIEAILISVALADKIKLMKQEKESANVLFEEARTQSKY